MKLRRALVAVATTAAIASTTLLAATSANAAPSTPSAPSGLCTTGNPHYKPVLRTTISGLPVEIKAGSGWRNFTLTLDNPSQAKVTNIHLFAGVSSTTEGFKAFPTSQVSLQAYFPKTKRWENVTDTAGHTDGYFGWASISAHHHINIPMRINVTKKAPAGKAMDLGAGFYQDAKNKCTAITAATYKFQIIAPAKHA
ncbi:hypothetical protein [Streptomyces roseochromogenus]|uniref:Uncharacterized protein n=1 Tax=Streptomyces roseochromogenus subsp. oscitans DS 12.976 TaxID=1352936 RepID=V6JH85_STRRC|nr:hypothetical protein [Streptomyces roseochromogenus]EST18521.1 hypothetical protein M878_45205 [Streptomyces roseochromogenus subsp. oscitans DS 12.976]